ncbi:gephyrin-like molybdotransferase Glp [Mangrovimonas sp. DI 80]|uniref:molybdopterin molybdotransferase MoeA n=1 Tax=Mangrovimonas sp. DI 80 TaxID=1779330 RepID=UPI0009757E87|nr:gephyrin-like molybdotransferase Glp [Mangrovimonas sp. DI 80]OMP30549.1 molybdopterin molybdenumtransferase MoeA [Mangrovimonas sp. DI 80]
MISVSEALNILKGINIPHKSEICPLDEALGKVLFEDIYSPIDMPPFRQSAMDGYAIKWSNAKSYRLINESKAGDTLNHSLNDGEAVRIFTGALVPDAADTIVIQEHVTRNSDAITIDKLPEKSANIRPTGEQIKKGDLSLAKGTSLNEAAIGYLVSLGIHEVKVYTSPKVTIVVTGNELRAPGTMLKPGEIYESNAAMLSAALRKIGITNITKYKVEDTLEATVTTISKAIAASDVVFVSGGISVGDYDFVREALLKNNVEEVLYKINQKPGKPLWFGQNKDTFVFALPGNPASALTCFYVYALPLLKNYMGFNNGALQRIQAKTKRDIKNPSGKTLFLKAHLEHDAVEVLQGQSSSMLYTFALSNALVCIPEHITEVSKGDIVECIKLNEQ